MRPYFKIFMSKETEIARRRTFGIISHPDAGKTTLTEKLLLFGGAIQVAGAVKSNKIKKSATSDFMEIEKQRGISVATSVMGFEYRDLQINILDTPGHKDFAEDTYRTLTAVDSVIVVIDVAKGVEPQTEKLVEVSRMRKTPIIVFINKLDREGLDAFDLIDDIEQKLGLNACPLSWPIGMGQRFKGVYNIYENKLSLFGAHGKQTEGETIVINDINDPTIDKIVGESAAKELREEMETVKGIYPDFDKEAYLNGNQSPVFFGSAVNNFGVKELLDCFVEIAPPPLPRETEERKVQLAENAFLGFVVTITSNMASKKELVEEAYPGDVVGLYDSGNFKIGDTLSDGESLHFKGLPSFSPEQFRFVNNADPMKSKQLAKGLEQLMDEGVAQLFIKEDNGRKIVGTVGALQFDVIQFRLEHEYGAKCTYEPVNLHKACWVTSEKQSDMDAFVQRRKKDVARDKDGLLVYLAESAWALNTARENHPEIDFHLTNEG